MVHLMKKLKLKPKLKLRPKPRLKKPVRRNPYSRALDQATARYDKAVDEYRKHKEKLMKLSVEIPRLRKLKEGIEVYLGMTPNTVEQEEWLGPSEEVGTDVNPLPELTERVPPDQSRRMSWILFPQTCGT